MQKYVFYSIIGTFINNYCRNTMCMVCDMTSVGDCGSGQDTVTLHPETFII